MDLLDPNTLATIFGNAIGSDFLRTCAIFALAAKIHSHTVAKQIKLAVGELVTVVQADLDQQRKISSELTGRVANIEFHLKLGGTDGSVN